ncbi:MAG: nicotinate-nucleotide adenylyltransferase [Syntrophobacteraceae bacterium]|jgi:nicotinate-nucleotide adenylyltransferase
MPLRLGVLGGTFDPVHLGHLRAAQETLDLLGLDEMVFVPVSVPPHKPGGTIASFQARLQMLRLAIGNNPRFRVSDIERRMPGKSYTVHTLGQLRQENPGAELFFLVGGDAFFEIDTWYRFGEIFRLSAIVVLCRPGCGEGEQEILEFVTGKVSDLYRIVPESREIRHPALRSVYNLRNTRMDISSTRIRELAAQGRSVRYLVPDDVLGYIVGNELYRKAERPAATDCSRNNDARSGDLGGS